MGAYIEGMENTRTNYMRLTLSDSEAEAIKEAAEALGLKPAAWCRHLAVKTAKGILDMEAMKNDKV